MGKKEPLPDWLPPGWKMQVKRRNNGRKYRSYTDPSNKCKFHSKPEVLRYLESIQTSNRSTKVTKKSKQIKRSAENKAVVEGLPPGWIKEIRTTRIGHKIRRDSYYIDPVSGHVFRSMREVARYLETGIWGRRRSVQKVKANKTMNKTMKLGDKLPPLAAEPKRRGDSGSDNQVNGDRNLTPGSEDPEGADKRSSSLPGAKCLDKAEKREPRKQMVSDRADSGKPAANRMHKVEEKEPRKQKPEANRTDKGRETEPRKRIIFARVEAEELPREDEFQEKKTVQRKRRKEKEADLPRRTSKRLAGLGVDSVKKSTASDRADGVVLPSPESQMNGQDLSLVLKMIDQDREPSQEPKMDGRDRDPSPKLKVNGQDCRKAQPPEDNQTCQAVENQLDSTEGATGKDSVDPGSSDKQVKGTVTNKADQKQQYVRLLPEKKPKDEDSTEARLLPKKETPHEACQAGTDLQNPKKHKTPPQAGTSLNNPKKHGMPPETSGDLWTDPCIEFAIKTLTGEIPVIDEYKITETPRSSTRPDSNICSPPEQPLGDLWTDPCFEFAVKTLTSDIPFGDGKPLGSNGSQGNSGLTLSDLRLGNLADATVSSRHFEVTPARPQYKQPFPRARALPRGHTDSLHNSVGRSW